MSRLELAALPLVPGVSVWYARLGHPPGFAHDSDPPHYAASLIKLAVLYAAHRDLDLDAQVLVHDEFPSVVSGSTGPSALPGLGITGLARGAAANAFPPR